MDSVVTAMGLSPGDLLNTLATVAPLVGIAVIVSFGLGILSSIIDGLNQGKATMGHKARWDDGIDGIKSGKYHG